MPVRESHVVLSDVFDFIDEELQKIFATCYSQKNDLSDMVRENTGIFQCKILRNKGSDFLTDPRKSCKTKISANDKSILVAEAYKWIY